MNPRIQKKIYVILSKIKIFLSDKNRVNICIVLLVLFIASIAARKALLMYGSGDYVTFVSPWYDFIKTHGHFGAFKYRFSDYSPSYLYLITVLTFLPIPKLFAIKGLSILFDYIMATGVFLIVREKYKGWIIPIIAGFVILFGPSILVNSSMWAQCDSIYTAFLIFSLLYILRGKYNIALLLFSISIAIKFQAVFFSPVILLLYLKDSIKLKQFLIIPVVYIISIIPAWIEDRHLGDLLTIYATQTSQYKLLTSGAPNLFQWLNPNGNGFEMFYKAFIAISIGIILIICLLVHTKFKRLSNQLLIELSFIFVLLAPFILPRMHERYFYIADVMSIIYAFYFPKRWYISVLMQVSSFISYTIVLGGVTQITRPDIAIVMLGILLYLMGMLFGNFVVEMKEDKKSIKK